MAGTFARQKGAEVIYVCDVDDVAMQKGINAVSGVTGKAPKGEKDFRKILDDKNLMLSILQLLIIGIHLLPFSA